MATTTQTPIITITHTFTGWWVARDGRGLHVHPFTTEGAALAYQARLMR